VAVLDVTDPTQPRVVASVTNSARLNGAYRIRIRGNFAYTSAVNVAAIAAIDISNPLSPRTAGSVTDTAHLNRTTGLDVDPTARYVVATSPHLPAETVPLYPPYPPASGGPALTGSVSLISLDPVAIGVQITSKPANPTTRTTVSFAFATTDAVSSLECALDGGSFGACTSATTQQYTSLSPGSHTFTVRATDAAGRSASASYTWRGPRSPANTAAPKIAGTPAPGQKLSATSGSWLGTPAPTFLYGWVQCAADGFHCRAIPGATGLTYTPAAADLGLTLRFAVRATNAVGSAPAISDATAAVTKTPPRPVIIRLSQAATTWRASRKLAQITSYRARRISRKGLPVGTTFLIKLNEGARVTLAFTHTATGRAVNGHCQAQTPQNRRQASCVLAISAGTLAFAAHPGTNQIRFAGRIARGKQLKPGAYALAVTADAAGQHSKPRMLTFTIVA
jgi:hypothetical protein